MQISRRRYVTAKKGTSKFQAAFRGVQTRRLLAAIRVATYYRKYRAERAFKMLRSAVIALQCKIRCIMAQKVVAGLKGEQKNIGKLRENNERLKMEMNSLKAMLAAQAKESASNTAHSNELQAKQDEITKLESRVAELESQLAKEKAIIEKLEKDLQTQKEQAAKDLASFRAPPSPTRAGHASPKASKGPVSIDPSSSGIQMPSAPSVAVDPEILIKHKKNMSKLEQQLRVEKKLRRDADCEVIKLRAAINGVQLSDAEVKDLLIQKQQAGKQGQRYVVMKHHTNICRVNSRLVTSPSCTTNLRVSSAMFGLVSKLLCTCIFMGFA